MVDFQVGGQDRQLTEAEQLAQLSWYMQEHYPQADRDVWLARLPDRLTHAAMMMLGAAVDHSMPGVAFTEGVSVSETPEGMVFTPANPTGGRVVSMRPEPMSRTALDNAWYPEVAAAANLSGCTIIDVHPNQVEHALRQVPGAVLWGTSTSAGVAVAHAEQCAALLLTRPGALEPPKTWPPTLVQCDVGAETWPGVEVRTYVANQDILTPTVARQRIMDAADFLRERSRH